jgi:hypothetical protein
MVLSSVHYFVHDAKGLDSLIEWWALSLKIGDYKDNEYRLEGVSLARWPDNYSVELFYPDDRRNVYLQTGDRVTFKDGHFDVIQRNHDR